MIVFQICSHMRFLRCFKNCLQYINQRLRVLRVFLCSWSYLNHCLRVLRVAPVLTTSMSESPSISKFAGTLSLRQGANGVWDGDVKCSHCRTACVSV